MVIRDLIFTMKYLCVRIGSEKGNLEFTFRKEDEDPDLIILQFTEAEICRFEIGTGFANIYQVDLFYRGRYLEEDQLLELSPTGKKYFYLNFLDGDYFEILTTGVFVIDDRKQ
jgi:hypothetical protein